LGMYLVRYVLLMNWIWICMGQDKNWFYTVMGPMRKVKSALEATIERNLLTLMD
jgi:hypothetical protein